MKRRTIDAARALAARRRTVTRRCEECTREITGIVTRRFCSAACRLRASRRRRHEHAPVDMVAAVEMLIAVADALAVHTDYGDVVELLRRQREARAAALSRNASDQ
ncbi:MAG: hypothetical protein HYX51_05920 [Chloroflexi bacterium]|nr:hypothetical protein [Chloroflexota bacterium]